MFNICDIRSSAGICDNSCRKETPSQNNSAYCWVYEVVSNELGENADESVKEYCIENILRELIIAKQSNNLAKELA